MARPRDDRILRKELEDGLIAAGHEFECADIVQDREDLEHCAKLRAALAPC